MKKKDIETLESIYYAMKKGYDIHLDSCIGKKLINLIDSEKAKIKEEEWCVTESNFKEAWDNIRRSFESLDRYQKLKETLPFNPICNEIGDVPWFCKNPHVKLQHPCTGKIIECRDTTIRYLSKNYPSWHIIGYYEY